MGFRLTFIASAAPMAAETVNTALTGSGIVPSAPIEWLEPGVSAHVSVSARPSQPQIQALWNILEKDRIDVLCTPHPASPVKLFIADMDATMVEGETLDDLAAHAGLQDKVSAITARAMNGELDFKAALRERVALLKGLPVSALDETLADVRLSPGAEELIRTLRQNGAICVLVSGGFTFFTQAVAARLGFHHHHGNVLDIQGDKLTGTVKDPILDKDSKRNFLETYTHTLGIRMEQTMAIGDGANDLPMLEAAGLGIGYRPKSVLRERLLNCWFYNDLKMLSFL